MSVTGTGSFTVDTPHTEITGGTLNVNCDENQIDGNVTIVGNVNITGNLTVQGAIECTSTIHAVGEIKSDADVKAGAISLKDHVHTEQGDGSDTSKPK